jgi:hypothetical protein
LTIRRYFKDLPFLQQDEEEVGIDINLKNAFQKASEKDWQAVFIQGPIDELGIPKEAECYLTELISHLKIYDFGSLPEDIVGELFEELIEPNQRHLLGQYFTREDLVDLIIATVSNDTEKYYIDPACGSGTFLIRLYSRLKYLSPSLRHEEILGRIWGVDVGKFPAELSTINLFRQDASNFENFPRILNRNIFDIKRGDRFEFPPPNAGKNYIKIKVKLPEFYGIVGNFPFIRQELIERKIPGVKAKLTKLIAEEYLIDYPKLFNMKGFSHFILEDMKKNKDFHIARKISEFVDEKYLDLRLSGQSDIYAYIFIHTTTLLSKDGSLAIISSNSWLDTSYGSVLKEFLLDYFKIRMVVSTWAEPWFEDASVNTVFTVLERSDDKNERYENYVNFVKIKKKLSELIPERDIQLESFRRWQRIDGIIRIIDSARYKSKHITVSFRQVCVTGCGLWCYNLPSL